MTEIIVCKYGGSSLNTLDDLKRVGVITSEDPRRRVIVVSAPGKRNKKDDKVTDLLIRLGETRSNDLISIILDRFAEQNPACDLSGVNDELVSIINSNLPKEALLDSLKAIGERTSAKNTAEVNNFVYVPAEELFYVTEDYGNAQILSRSKTLINSRLRGIGSPVVTAGFYGIARNGRIAAMARNCSDVSAAYIAASLNGVIELEKFTDQEGVYTASRDIIRDAVKIEVMTFREMRDLSYSGFNILHPKVINFVGPAGISVHIRNSLNYTAKGTYIVEDRISDDRFPIIGIAYKDHCCTFNVDCLGLDDRVGVLADLANIFKRNNLSVIVPPTGIDDISFVLDQGQLCGNGFVSYIKKQLELTAGKNSTVDFCDNLACVVLAGKGISRNMEFDALSYLAMTRAGIDIKFHSKGAKRRSIIYGVESRHVDDAVRILYNTCIIRRY